ncbi:MAG: DNA ligase D [Deltaproteobacteria bacterium]|nr:DNA ligase D [Deltaproteobacteria bacterium]
MRGRPLARYDEMRDFDVTREPSGEVHASESGRSFVIQKHDATRLHYDFRLEHGGVLWSWAVPKGPSLDPKDKRLAVQTEDHPVDYRDFEGTIPEGEYGGGPVIVWDRGTWEPLGDPDAMMKKGRIDFVVHGEKLHGRFVLVRLREEDREGKKRTWLLIKRDDEHVRKGKAADIVSRLPRSVLTHKTIDDIVKGVKVKPPAFGSIGPQLATLVDAVPKGGDWIYEIKYDGYRAIATIDHGKVRLASRNGKDWTKAFQRVANALAHVRVQTAVLDGEIAYVKEDGRTDFQLLQNNLDAGDGAGAAHIVYFVFDLLHLDGEDLRALPLVARKDKLRTILAGEKPPLMMGGHVSDDGEAFFDQACKLGLEGIIAKRANAPYTSKRTKDWVKVKCQLRQELVIVGFTAPKGSRSGIGALLLGVHDGESEALRYAGKVGTGFSQRSLDELSARLSKLVVERPPVRNAPRLRDARWVEPKLVCQVRFTEWTRDGALRHPAFEGLREDKPARKVKREREKHVATGGVTISNADRVVDEASGTTKGDLVRWAEIAGPLVLPFAKKRPLMLVRATGAFGAGTFVQKHAGRGLVESIGRADVDGEEVLFMRAPEDMVVLAQNNAVEIHGWGSRLPRTDRPDWIVFDLDPDVGLPFRRVVDAALRLREDLKRLGLDSFVKTTGGKGLHVVVPLTPKDDWQVVKAFAGAVATAMAKAAPNAFVATMSKAARKGKIFVDWFRNGEGATAVLPYSARARPSAPVAMPVAWKDLTAVDPLDFTVKSAPAFLHKRRRDPWEALLATKQTLPRDLVKALRSKE